MMKSVHFIKNNNEIWNYKILLNLNNNNNNITTEKYYNNNNITTEKYYNNNNITIEKYYNMYNEIRYIIYWFYKYYKKFILLLSKTTNDFINENHNIDIIYKIYNTLIINNSKFLIIMIFKNNEKINKYSLKLKSLIIELLNIYLNNLENSILNKYSNSIRKNLNILYKINTYFELDNTLNQLFNKVKILEMKIYM